MIKIEVQLESTVLIETSILIPKLVLSYQRLLIHIPVLTDLLINVFLLSSVKIFTPWLTPPRRIHHTTPCFRFRLFRERSKERTYTSKISTFWWSSTCYFQYFPTLLSIQAETFQIFDTYRRHFFLKFEFFFSLRLEGREKRWFGMCGRFKKMLFFLFVTALWYLLLFFLVFLIESFVCFFLARAACRSMLFVCGSWQGISRAHEIDFEVLRKINSLWVGWKKNWEKFEMTIFYYIWCTWTMCSV